MQLVDELTSAQAKSAEQASKLELAEARIPELGKHISVNDEGRATATANTDRPQSAAE